MASRSWPGSKTAEAVAKEIIATGLKLRGWRETDLKAQPKGDTGKVALAARLRAENTQTVVGHRHPAGG